MGRIVFGGAMSHVLDPDYYERACGSVGRQKVEAAMAEIARMGERCSARNPDALIVVADDHLNAFSFNAVPALCVRIGRYVQRMAQDHAEAFDKVLDHMPERYPLHETLANRILEVGLESGFDLNDSLAQVWFNLFDRKLIHWMEEGEHEPLLELTVGELHKSGEHELLNWMVLLGAVTPARADVRYFGELPRINLAAVEWRL